MTAIGRRPVEEPLRFTDHALVRYVERHVDERAVRDLRRRGVDEHALAAHLRLSHAGPICAFLARARQAFDGRSSQMRNVVCGVTYAIVLGDVPLVISGETCITVRPSRKTRHRHAA